MVKGFFLKIFIVNVLFWNSQAKLSMTALYFSQNSGSKLHSGSVVNMRYSVHYLYATVINKRELVNFSTAIIKTLKI